MSALETTILVVDDQPDNINVLAGILSDEGYDIRMCLDGKTALKIASDMKPDLILLDVTMPEMDGFDVCRQLKAKSEIKDIPVIFLTARVDTEDVVAGFQMGGVDYITKPFKDEELKVRVSTQLRLRRLVTELTEQKDALEQEIAQRKAITQERDDVVEERDHLAGRLSVISDEEARHWGIDGFVGKSKTVRKIVEDIERLQQSTNTSVLITGESGTGKELVARAIHFGSLRAKGPFVPVNCSAVPHELADSLFFGHVKGAFTGADQNREGYFQLADGGTLFLDEVGDMPLDLQAKLLRVLEERQVMPLGGKDVKEIDVRLVSATNVNFEQAIQAGQFREDLYYRLSGFPVLVPPLRERKEDIPLLVEHFLTLFGSEMGLHDPQVTSDAIDILTQHSFPGNIRELKNVIERALIVSNGQAVAPQHVMLETMVSSGVPLEDGVDPESLPWNLAKLEATMIERAIMHTGGNVSKAAKLLGIHRSRLYRILAQG